MDIRYCKWLSSIYAEMQNGHSSNVVHESVADIKAAAKEQALKVRGASATSLLRAARDQLQTARALEGNGELRDALSALTKTVTLIGMFMDTSEFKMEMQPGKKGVLTKDLMNFQSVSISLESSEKFLFIAISTKGLTWDVVWRGLSQSLWKWKRQLYGAWLASTACWEP